MSEASDRLLYNTSAGVNPKALLVLEDGSMYAGTSCGAAGEAFGEICFNTSLTGYLEIATDPSYAGQIVCMTYPQIGNYGVNEDDMQRERLALSGMVVHSMCRRPSNWRSAESFPDFLSRHGVVAIEGVDTRDLVRRIRDFGAQRAVISTEDLDPESLRAKVLASPGLAGVNLAATVSRAEPREYTAADLPKSRAFAQAPAPEARYRVVAYDCGMKDGILEGLVRAGCRVVAVPWDTPAQEVLAMEPDGVFFSNGPGDPDPVEGTYRQLQALLGKVPIFGICLGHQMLGKACGAQTEKLKFGHHGGNQPVMNLRTRRVEITAQNHGFGLLFESLGELIPQESGGFSEHAGDLRFWVEHGIAPVVRNELVGRIQLTHVNLNDGTPEGIACLDVPAFSVQYHPEASPGPTDAHYLFTAFTRLMDAAASRGAQSAADAGALRTTVRGVCAIDPISGTTETLAGLGERETSAGDYAACLDIDIAQDRLAGWQFDSAAEGRSSGKEA